MKIGKLFLTAVVALGLMACNNEEVPQIEGAESTISIKVFPSSDSPSFRALGDLSGDGVNPVGLVAESAIKTLEVWVFQGDALDGYGVATSSDETGVTEVKEISAHVGTKTVVVAANANIGREQFSLKTLLETLKGMPTDATNGLIMTAIPTVVELKAGNNYYGYEGESSTANKLNYITKDALKITRVNARVAITSATLESIPSHQELLFDNLKNVEVAMFNVPEKTLLFVNPLATNENYKFGAKWPSPASTYVGAGVDDAEGIATLMNAVTDALPIVIDNAPYYYVNESSGDDKMFIVLRAKPYLDDEPISEEVVGLYTDEDGYTYYPVWINKDGLTASDNVGNGNVYRNTQYNIELKIKGLGNPSIDPVEEAVLDVKVTVDPWIVVTQNVSWGS